MSSRLLPGARWASVAIFFASVFSVVPGTVQGAPDALLISTQGANGAPACMLCHGAQGEGNPVSGFPRLAGAGAAYLQEQLEAIANGSRVSPVMTAIAKTLEPAQREAVSRFYAALPSPLDTDRLAATAQQSPKPADVGAWLAIRGAWDRNIPACNQCHGPGGIGVGDHFPSLAGQPAAYLSEQLRLWRENQRPPGPLGLMAAVATRLTDAEITAVSAYYAGLPRAADPLTAQAGTAAKAKP
ncbi:c-type cytochrome [Achromobacter xylosoxidans]|uniref:c-type cytochrome n=1 Tax=Alcaligenes xylosoxydans xylosoxydans TaxID=85698 RepID=UPI0006C6BCA4|nr:c-type cytochrome [Achromobacter xylosoxidans]CUJ67376.1 Cytochrome c4 precursor [Achromobacter xylosoxidans]